MSDITVTAAQVSMVKPHEAVIKDYIAGVAITKGQAVYVTTAGKLGVADANDAGKEQCRGIALNSAGAGQAVSVLQSGEVAGFAITGLNVDALVYLSDTAGALADAAGTKTVPVGRVSCMADKDLTKVLRVFTSWMANW
jgi:hypothetical protein